MEEPYERLRRARQRVGLKTAAEAARKFGWNTETYKSHENGQRGVRRSAAERYARAFQVSAGWILTGEGEREAILTPKELDLIRKYRQLPSPAQRAVRALIQSYFEPAEEGAAAGKPPTPFPVAR